MMGAFFAPRVRKKHSLPQRIILRVADGFAPLGGAPLAGELHGNVAEPAVRRGAVPVLYPGGDGHDAAGREWLGSLALLLIPARAVHAEQKLSAAAGGFVDMPAVAAAGLEGDVRGKNAAGGVRQGLQIAPAGEILRVSVVRRAEPEEAAVDLRLLVGIDLSFACRNAAHALGQPA